MPGESELDVGRRLLALFGGRPCLPRLRKGRRRGTRGQAQFGSRIYTEGAGSSSLLPPKAFGGSFGFAPYLVLVHERQATARTVVNGQF